MTKPTIDQLDILGSALEAFTRRYKLPNAINAEKALNELDNQTLFYVAQHPGCGPSDVARFLATRNTTISSATDRLVKRGYLARARAETDRRAVSLALTDAGRIYVTNQLDLYREMHRRILDRLLPEERDPFIAMIARISYDDD